jgi:DNA helicase-2/ATP-dependent DNA helicase PcrA
MIPSERLWQQMTNLFGILHLMRLRKTQEEILQYTGGRMAISAVPGSGKTFILSLLTAKLLSQGFIDPDAGQQVLIVTYMNASVETFRASIRLNLERIGLEPVGFEVRTLHSLALDIVQNATGGADGKLENVLITDEAQSINFISLSVSKWIGENPGLWESLLPDSSPQESVRWRGVIEKIAKVFIREAKNYRYSPDKILFELQQDNSEASQPLRSLSQLAEERERYLVIEIPLLGILAEIYALYQSTLTRQSAMDFDDLIWSASDILKVNREAATMLRKRWPYVLEDEAQDSVPLQERLLELITGQEGNWVRVGDPNQAIMSTFTASHPKQFNSFLDREDVKTLPLPHSGRNAPVIFGAANSLVNWVRDSHPVPEVRANAFRQQMILPTPEGDGQPNPPNDGSSVKISVFRQREEEELPRIAELAIDYSKEFPDHTLAILLPTNDLGYEMARKLDERGADYDQHLRSDNQVKEIAASLSSMLSLLADPLDKKALAGAYSALYNLGHPALLSDEVASERILTILLSVHKPESFLFATDEDELAQALPLNVANELELRYLAAFSSLMKSLFELRPLAFDDLILALSDELFSAQKGERDRSQEMDLAVAYHLSGAARSWLDIHPDWRLPEISAQLTNVARGSHSIPFNSSDESGYKPTPGRITLATQHRAKGGEWDAVFLVGIDGGWIPSDLDAPFFGMRMPSGNDPSAEAIAQLRLLMEGSTGLFAGRSATDTGHIEIICERLRLFYVGITRARRFLHISRSRSTRRYDKVFDSEPATALGVLYRYIEDHSTEQMAA